MAGYDGYIGVFDSGVGGISVLKALVEELPHERFVYFGDNAHAPYGDKPDEEVQRLSIDIVERLLADGVKTVVIACNTATSAAKLAVRAAHPQVPILGVEPALKPALEADNPGDILVLATRMTLKRDSYKQLVCEYGWISDARIIQVPCSGLANLIDGGDLDGPEIQAYLREHLERYRGRVGSVVLGCTHYPFVRRQIAQVVGDVPFFDGGEGTARHLRHRLEENDLLAPETQEGAVEFRTSSDDPTVLPLFRRLYGTAL